MRGQSRETNASHGSGRVNRIQVLFIDDDPSALDQLQSLLHHRAPDWRLVMTHRIEDAVAELARHAFDVVVADLHLPEVSGAELLAHVQEHQPAAARLLMCQASEVEIALRVAPAAQQLVLKPADGDVLENAIERCTRLQHVIRDPTIAALVGGVQALPAVPRIHLELTRVLARPEVTISEVVQVIEQDPALHANLLRLANSALLGMSQRVSDARQAVILLGTRMIQALALVTHLFTVEVVPRHYVPRLERLRRHALLVGGIARQIAIIEGVPQEEAFVAGLLHDVGKTVLMLRRPELFDQIDVLARIERRAPCDIERGLVGVTHAEIGGCLLERWGLPYPVTEAVTYHHTPQRVLQLPGLDVLTLTYVANGLANEQEGRWGVDDAVSWTLDEAYLVAMGIGARLERWRDVARVQLGVARTEV